MVLPACDVHIVIVDDTIQSGVPNLNQINLIGHLPRFFGERSLEA